jgi:hypothetical protein
MGGVAVEWLAFGVDIQLAATEAGGRLSAVLLDVPYRYRPNWVLPASGGMHAAAPVLCGSAERVEPGGSARVVIVPLVLGPWRVVVVGDVLSLLEGARLCGSGTVSSIFSAKLPLREADETRLCAWARDGQTA